MSASAGGKKKAAAASSGLTGNLGRALRAPGRWSLAPVAIIALAAGGWGMWQHTRERVLAEPQYQVTYDRIDMTPLPAWIRSEIKIEALRDASLDEPMSLLDRELPTRIAKALELHPWVAKVDRVEPEYPARIRVDVTYRRPVCMVELPQGYYPLAHDATLLPTGDFTVSEPKKYPQLKGITSTPLGVVGTRWEDPRVMGGAAVAGTLVENWETWQLAGIIPSDEADGGQDRDEHTYRLVTRAGAEIIWGHPPGREISPEPDAAGKIARLASRFAERGSFDPPAGQTEAMFDLRSNVVPVAPPRTAAKP